MKIDKSTRESAKALKAVADKARLSVIKILLEKSVCVNEIIKAIKIEPTLLSHHLLMLKNEGIVESKREGKRVRYRITPKVKVKGKTPGLDLKGFRVLFK